MDLDTKFDKKIYPDVWHFPAVFNFTTTLYTIKMQNINCTPPVHYIVSNHSHSYFEIHFCISGKGDVIIDDKKYVNRPGTFFITGPGVYHSQISPKNSPTAELCFSVSIEPTKSDKSFDNSDLYNDLDDVLNIILENKSYFGEDKYNAVEYINNIYKTACENDLCINLSELWINMLHVFSTIAKNIQPLPLSYTAEKTAKNLYARRVYILDDIFTGYHREMTPEIAAERLNVSVRQLNRITLKYYGMSFKQKFLNSRMELASTLLQTPDFLTLDEVSQKLGFSSLQSFTKNFKKHYGVSPTQYKKQFREM